MAKIIISEKDLTRPDNIEENDNIVYVPGYSLMGPENTTTLCRTVNEFESIFGTMPYKFKGNKTINNVKIASDGEYEKSFIYAHELLSLGLPILFTRFIDTTGSTNKKATTTSNALEDKKLVTITAKQYGEFGNNIHCTFKPNSTYSISEKVYDFSEYLGDKPSNLTTTLISFNPNSNYYFDNSKYEYVDFSLTDFQDEQTLITTETKYDLEGGADDFDLTKFYTYIGTEDNYEYIKDKNSCKVKYITSGSYPTIIYGSAGLVDVSTATQTMINVAAERGDATAVIDFDNRKIDNS